MVNHHCEPNVRIIESVVGVRSGKRHVVFIFALEPIKAGSEVNIDYGDDKAEVKIKPHGNRPIVICDFDSAFCTGFVWRT